jgi:GNAT superfamily N-acetyltransferase
MTDRGERTAAPADRNTLAFLDRRAAADANAVAAFDLVREVSGGPRRARARFGLVDVVAADAGVAFFNTVLALDPGCRSEDVLAGAAWVEAMGLPVSVQLGDQLESTVGAALRERGLVADAWAMPVMALSPIPAARSEGVPGSGGVPDGLEIRIGGVELFEDFHAASGSGAAFRRILGPAFLGEPRVRVVVGVVAGDPVSCALAIRDGSTVGIYVVATVERARRRGYARAVTWAAIDAGRSAWDGKIAILQSTAAGLPVYASLGFETLGTYTEYARPDA